MVLVFCIYGMSVQIIPLELHFMHCFTLKTLLNHIMSRVLNLLLGRRQRGGTHLILIPGLSKMRSFTR